MTESRIQVVVAYDFTRSGTAALQRALGVAERAPFHNLHVACVAEPHGMLPGLPRTGPVDFAYTERVQQAVADTIGLELKSRGVADRVHFFVHVRIGKAAVEILSVARDVGADLIIIGSHGHVGLERLLLGSVAERVVREAQCTVEVARAKTYPFVPLAEITEVEPTHTYVPPHRYSYEDHRVAMRPDEWPLY